jgi:mono/diheme cytochrome c family protein
MPAACCRCAVWSCLLVFGSAFSAVRGGDEASSQQASAQRGYRLLTTRPYLPPDFDQDIVDNLWRVWEEPLRAQAEKAAPHQRRNMVFSRYGLTERPGEPDGFPLQYVDAGQGRWAINCFACHGGKVAGRVIPGLPNSHFAFQTLADEVRAIKLSKGQISKRDVLGSFFPLGSSNGTTNAVSFGVAVLAVRDADLNFVTNRPIPKFVHHDVDPPPWWNTKYKRWLYADGGIQSDHRALMPFLLSSPENTAQTVRAYEDDFKHIYAWILSLQPPKYPFDIDRTLAARGELAFNRTCTRCHGTYGPRPEYPNKIVPLDEVGTDPVRLQAITAQQQLDYQRSWLSYYGEKKVNVQPRGYVAPPLHGIWASAPYFHNGSVPTLWHVFHPDRRPVVWRRTEDGYDQQRVGLEVTELTELPPEAANLKIKRQYFDTRMFGKSAAGHTFPDELSEAEKRAVLEYLKTL